MDVLLLTLFASLMLVLCAVVFFAWNVKQRSHEHNDRLALLPLDTEDPNAHGHDPNRIR